MFKFDQVLWSPQKVRVPPLNVSEYQNIHDKDWKNAKKKSNRPLALHQYLAIFIWEACFISRTKVAAKKNIAQVLAYISAMDDLIFMKFET